VTSRYKIAFALGCFFLINALSSMAGAQQFKPTLYQEMRWRCIGPHRGGRTVAAAGVPGQPNVFYIGVNNGGVWRSNDYGRTWNPIFDDQPTGSIGALAVAPSNPDVIYAGSGEGLQRPDLSTGDGIYKSTDTGKTWKHLGLGDGQQIGAIIVDPRDPNRLFVAVLGHPYGPNQERGVFRSTDGGAAFQRVLYIDENTGAIALQFDPSNSQTVYADLWAGRQGPWENGAWQGPESGLFKSTDGGNNWRKLTKGLPIFEQGLGRIGFCVAPSDSKRIYALVDASPQLGGLYRSDDAGENWRLINSDARLWGRGSDFAEVKVDPRNADILYDANVVTWRSTDGGQNFSAFRGAPGGDDYHTVWVSPDNSQIILIASDQGAIVTVNGGWSWSSWYNQPTAQFYHVITDNRFPYWVYGGQQESGSVGIASRGNDGQITFREWHPVAVEEYGYVAPDPLNPNLIYGGKITRFDWSTGQVQNVAPDAIRDGRYRFLRTAPVIFSPVDPHILYFAGNVLFKTTDGGNRWDIISPDLSREAPEVPESIGVYRTPEMAKQPRRGVIYTVAPSHRDGNVIWAGTDDGLIQITRDGGKSWANVTPPGVTPWSKVSIVDASHFDANTAYAAVNRIRLDDQRPHIYRTHDAGKTWKEITTGLGDSGPVNVVREDPIRPGLLFCGSERAVYVSFNDGDNWQPLRLNMPASSIRDLVIKDDDLVVGTHGRSFWILDDITPLRQISEQLAASEAFLFKPQLAYRVRWNMNPDTPLPPDEPAGKNPPDGAIIDYHLSTRASGEAVLEIFDGANKLVHRYSSTDKPESIESISKQVNIPPYWIRPQQILSVEPGMHRFLWNLHYAAPEGEPPEFPIAAIYRDTERGPLGPWALPGNYTVKLTVGGRSYTQPLTVKMDPRVKTSQEGLAEQHAIAMRCYEGLHQVHDALEQVRKLISQLKELSARESRGALADAIRALETKAGSIEGAAGGSRGTGRRGATSEPTLTRVHGELLELMGVVEGADIAPTTQAVAAAGEVQRKLSEVLSRWTELKEKDVKPLNEQLRRANLQIVDTR
jgi:photosystem II stability/assembly factor-like uncharacterized protein